MALLFVALYCLGPVLWQFWISLSPASDQPSLKPALPSSITLENFTSVIRLPSFLRALRNSLIVSSASTILSLAFGSMAAFALARMEVKHKTWILAAVLSASMFPPIATVSPLYLLWRALQLRDTMTSLILTYTTFSLPLAVWVMTNYFESLPDEILSAARVDGCTAFQSYSRVLLPLSAPGLAATAILVFIYCWNEFLYALTFTATDRSRTVPVAIALFPGIHEAPWGEIAAASMIVTVPLFVVVFLFQKRIIEGLTAGAVRG